MNKNRSEDGRYRKRYHKCAHDRKLRDPFWMKLSFEAKGLLSLIECMMGSTMEGDHTGVLHGEDGHKISADEFLFLIGDGSDARDEEIKKLLKLLCRARQLNARRFENSGTIQLVHWHDDQEVPASGDAERKRNAAYGKHKDEADELHGPLSAWFKALGNRKVTQGELLTFIKARAGGYSNKHRSILQIWYDSGVLSEDSSKLATLALPPSGVGLGADSVGAGAGENMSPSGNIPADQDQEPEKDSLTGIQLVPVGASADTRSHLGEGGESERSEQRDVASDSISASAGRGPSVSDPVHPSRDERPIPPPVALCDCLYQPSDAYEVDDPIHATERLLCETPGWNSQPPRQDVKSDPPLSQHALLARYRSMSKAHGPKAATEMWRQCLSALIADMVERRAMRSTPPRSWTALFMSNLKKVRPVVGHA